MSEEGDWNEIGIYREYTVAMLRRYFRMSIDMGKLPSVLGQEFFRAKVSSSKMHTFEDVVIYVHDMEQCLSKVDSGSRWLLARVVFQEYSVDEVAEVLQMSGRQLLRRYVTALDRLSEILLQAKLLLPLDAVQGGRTVRSVLNDCAGGILGADPCEDALPPRKPLRKVRWTKVERRMACGQRGFEEARDTASKQRVPCKHK